MIDYILSFLCDDDEQIETIIGRLNCINKTNCNLQNVLPIILKLYNEGKITIAYPYNTEKIDMQHLNEYWFAITKIGKSFFEENQKD